MDLKKKIEVVMLPTEKASIILSNNSNTLVYDKSTVHLGGYKKDAIFTPQHLYFLSDEKIEANDWCLCDNRLHKNQNPEYFLAKCKYVVNEWIFLEGYEGEGYNPDWTKKIIATTDTSIYNYIKKWGYKNENESFVIYPQPSIQFIKKYIEEWNKGNKIQWVMMDYKTEYDWSLEEDAINFPLGTIPKVDKNNYITITKVKDSWNKEEVIEFGLKCLSLGMDLNNNPIPRLNEISGKEYYYKWLEKNI